MGQSTQHEHPYQGGERTEQDGHLESDHDVGGDRHDRLATRNQGQSIEVQMVKANPVAAPVKPPTRVQTRTALSP